MTLKDTVEGAAEKLPKKVRKHFLRAWEAADYPDTHYGDLAEYMAIIADALEARNDVIADVDVPRHGWYGW